MTNAFPDLTSTVLIGASGRVGRMLCRHWPDPNRLLQVQRRTEALAPGSLVWNPLDGPAAFLDHLSRADAGPMPFALIMMAGVTPGPGIDAAALAGNHALARACLNAAHQAGIRRVLLASSSAVYGLHPQGMPLDEDAKPAPFGAYGRAKLEMEAAAHPARDAGLEVTVLRIGNVAGADALLAPLTGRAPDGQPPLRIDAFGDGLGPLRSYIGAAGLARVLATLAHRPGPLPEVLNVAAPDPIRMTALAKAAGWPFALVPAPPTAHQHITLDCRRLQALCPGPETENLPETMVQNWKESWS